ncbi:MAG: aspartyl protease family protein, partial [Tepidiformaceae bacterium]
MGTTYVDAVLRGSTGREASVRFLVDSGATYSLVPDGVWSDLELEPSRTVTTNLADGTAVDRDVSECHFTLSEGASHSPVFLGEPGDQALLGAVTLENLGLVLDPFRPT